MKYKVGDKVRIKSLDWYTSNKNKFGKVWTESLDGESPICFDSDMIQYCGMETVIFSVERENYVLKGIPYAWTDEMLEAVNTDSPIIGLMPDSEGYELMIHKGYEVKQKNGKFYLVKKRPSYPKTYEECCKVLGYDDREIYCIFHTGADEILFEVLYKLKVCRDAYWKIAGEEMGLGKPWEMDPHKPCYFIAYLRTGGIIKKLCGCVNGNANFAFPTAEMRDAFKENFDLDIEKCKLLL